MVGDVASSNSSVVKRTRREDFPTPLSPTRSICNKGLRIVSPVVYLVAQKHASVELAIFRTKDATLYLKEIVEGRIGDAIGTSQYGRAGHTGAAREQNFRMSCRRQWFELPYSVRYPGALPLWKKIG